MTPPRYAIYYVPEADSELYRYGAAVLGYDSYRGATCPFIDGAPADWLERVREPQVYGFHATMKPPFRLADGVTEDDLHNAFLEFTTQHALVEAGAVTVRALGPFIALMPAAPCPPLNALADACVRDFDRFRAPLTAQDLKRRMTPGLTERHIQNIQRWGYPHVFEDFRFHMTLTGALPAEVRTPALDFLCAEFEQLPDAQSLTVDRLVIARQAEPGAPFTVTHQAPLAAR